MAELQRRAAVHAVQSEQTRAALIVAKQHQVFAQQPPFDRAVLQLIGKTDRMPVASQHLAARRAVAHPGQHFVFFTTQRHDSLSFSAAAISSTKRGTEQNLKSALVGKFSHAAVTRSENIRQWSLL